MKVVHVVTAFPRHDDDVITPWLGRLLLGLREAGMEPEVLAPCYRGGGAGWWRGIPVRRFRYAPAPLETLTHEETVPDRLGSRPWYGALLPFYLLGGTVASARAGLREAPDVVHVHWPVPHAWFGAVMRASSPGPTALVSSFYSVELRWIERRHPWALPFLRWSIETADAVTAISSSTAAAVRRFTDREVVVVPFGAATCAAPGARDRHGFSADGQGLRLLFVGRLVERKGVEVLLRALARVRERRQAVLTIVGEGPRRADLEGVVRRLGLGEAVRFAGRLSERELSDLYATSDLFVLPATVDRKGDTEGLGVVLLEALASGLPVVASDTGGIPDIVRSGDTGWLVPPGDAAALAEAILDAAANPAEAARRAHRGRERVERRFGLEGIVASLASVYETAIRHRRG